MNDGVLGEVMLVEPKQNQRDHGEHDEAGEAGSGREVGIWDDGLSEGQDNEGNEGNQQNGADVVKLLGQLQGCFFLAPLGVADVDEAEDGTQGRGRDVEPEDPAVVSDGKGTTNDGAQHRPSGKGDLEGALCDTHLVERGKNTRKESRKEKKKDRKEEVK